MKRVVLDCDPGIDDTCALIYLAALHHEGSVELEACLLYTSPSPRD